MPTTATGPARTHYEDRGQGRPLVLLHPALIGSGAMEPIAAELAPGRRLLLPDRRGHGRTADVPGPFTFATFADDVAHLVEELGLGAVDVLGYSDGAVVALHLAVRRPDLVRRLVVVSGVAHRDGWLPGVLDADAEPAPVFREEHARLSPDPAPHFDEVLRKVARMHETEPALTGSDLAGVAAPTLVMAGDDDEVRPKHLLEVVEAVPDAQLAVVPGTSHGVLVEKPGLCAAIIRAFLDEDPVPTLAPRRRAVP